MKILLVDDHQLFADGLKGILRTSSLEADVEAVNNGRDGLQKILSGIIRIKNKLSICSQRIVY